MNAQDLDVRHEIFPDKFLENFNCFRISGALLVPLLQFLLGHVVGDRRFESIQMTKLKKVCLNFDWVCSSKKQKKF